MPVKSYFSRDDQNGECKLLLHPYTDSKWVVGAEFLQNYYSIYDFKNKKIGLIESKK